MNKGLTHMTFRTVQLGKLIESVTHKFNSVADSVVPVNTSDVFDGKVLHHRYVSNQQLAGQFKKSFQKHDILFSEIRPIYRRIAFIDFDATDYVASTKFLVLRRTSDDVLIEFIYYVLQSSEVVQQLERMAEARSNTFPQLTFRELAQLTIVVPPLDKQRQIVQFMQLLDSKIALNERKNNVVERLLLQLHKQWFPPSLATYRRGKMNDFFKITVGKTPPRQESKWFCTPSDSLSTRLTSVEWASIADLGRAGHYIFTTAERLTAAAVRQFKINIAPPESILVSFKFTIGRIVITEESMATNEAIAHFHVPNRHELEYLYLFLKQVRFDQLSSTSSIAHSINVTMIRSLEVVLPPDEMLQQFHQLVKPMFQAIRIQEREAMQLTKLRNVILPQLIGISKMLQVE